MYKNLRHQIDAKSILADGNKDWIALYNNKKKKIVLKVHDWLKM